VALDPAVKVTGGVRIVLLWSATVDPSSINPIFPDTELNDFKMLDSFEPTTKKSNSEERTCETKSTPVHLLIFFLH
jgi:hypothetical protein